VASFQCIAPLPLITLDAGCTVTLEAIDPDTGAAVTGVIVSQVAIYGVNDVAVDVIPTDASTLYTVLGDELPAGSVG
jgi:hypothetical protein